MRLPRVRHDGKVYEITGYQKMIDGEYSDSRIAEKQDDILKIFWGRYCLSCTLREVVETDKQI